MFFNPGSKKSLPSGDVTKQKNSSGPDTTILKAVDNDEPEDDKVGIAKTAMNKIKGIELTIENIVSKEFRTPASSLSSVCNSLMADMDETTGKSGRDNMQNFLCHIKKYKILQYFCKSCELILKKVKPESYTGIEASHIKSLDIMLNFLIALSDQFSDASETISQQYEFLKGITDTLQNWHKNIPFKKIEMDIYWLESLITLLHNVSMYDDNLSRMRSVNTIAAVQPYLDFSNDTIRLLSLATIADLVNESESKMIQSGGDVMEFLMMTVSNALEMDSRSHDGWSLVELTRIIHQVARNDSNKRTVVKHRAIPLLIQICESSNTEEQAEAVKAIWRLSFDQDNKKEMLQKTEWKVVDVLSKLSQSEDQRVRRISNKALWTINDQKETSFKDKTSIDEKSTKPLESEQHIMISYNWGHQSIAKQIRDRLTKAGHKIWMDVDNMHGSTIQAMASAVEQAFIILICFSYQYKNSDNCRAEAEYAFQLKKKIVPVKMEIGYKADGWLGFIIGAKLFFDFSGKYQFESKIAELIREVSNKEKKSSDKMPVVESSTVAATSPPVKHHLDRIGKIRKWKESDVEKWLTKHDLSKEKFGILRGKDVAFLCLLLQESPDNFYRILRKQLHIKDIASLANIRFALHDIVNKHSS